jgi:uncharacterized protein (TIGR00369 family)
MSEHPFERMRPGGPHIFRTLGYRMLPSQGDRAVVEWDATEEYGFPAGNGTIVHGGMVTTLLDQAMGHASVAALQGTGDSFLTADLHVEFHRSALPGVLRGEGWVVHQSRRVLFCAAELFNPAGELLASARCTQILRSRG